MEEIDKKEVTTKVIEMEMINRNERNNTTKENYTVLKIGIWNVRGNGKEDELIDEFEKVDLDILAITKTKMKEHSLKELNKNYILICSGVREIERARAGVGYIVHNKWKNKIIECKRIAVVTI